MPKPKASAACPPRNASLRVGLLTVMCAVISACSNLVRWEDGGPVSQPPFQSQWPAASSADSYRVQSGDTLYSIAFRNNLDYRELAAWNGIGRGYLIRPGEVLRLSPPPGGQPEVVVPQPATRAGGSRPQTSASSPPPAVSSTLQWQWPLRGAVINRFLLPSSKGIDLDGKRGDPVKAAADGHVVYSGTALKGYGELVIIKHDESWLSAYGYNSKRLVKEGDRVRAGQQIAEVGDGPQQKAMLHFEVRQRGKPVDPLGLLPLASGSP